jgi:hypothetical protein
MAEEITRLRGGKATAPVATAPVAVEQPTAQA